jgi:iron complex outermembrane receptor protein
MNLTKILRWLLIVCHCLLIHQLGNSQIVVTGKVIDQSNSLPLKQALVYTETDTTTTNEKGEFSLRILDTNEMVSVRHIGYQPKSQSIPSDQFVILELLSAITELNEVVVQASGQALNIASTSIGVNIISKEMLKRNDPFETVAAINRLPGVYMHSGTLSTNRFTIRGIGSRSLFGTDKIKVYYGQIPITDGSGNSSIEEIDMSLIGRLEIYKGPNATLFGAGLAGVVRITPNIASLNQNSIETSLTVGSFGTLHQTTKLNLASKRNSVSLSYNTLTADGYRANSKYDRSQFGITSKLYLTKKSNLDVSIIYTDIQSFIPSAINFNDYQNIPTVAASTWGISKGNEDFNRLIIGTTYSAEIGDYWNVSATGFLSSRDAVEARPFNILEEKTSSIGLRTFAVYKKANTGFTLGSELFSDQYEWSTFRNLYTATSNGSVKGSPIVSNNEYRYYYNIFAEYQRRFNDDFTLTLGTNLNHTTYDLETNYINDNRIELSKSQFKPVISPRIGISYKLAEYASTFINLSHGFSPPTLSESQLPDGTINKNIRPETGWSLESGYRLTSNHFSVDATAYFMKINNLLVAQRTGDDAYIGVNAGINHHIGMDISIGYQVPIREHYVLNFFTTATLANYRFVDFTNRDIVYDGNQLTGVPSIQVNPGVELTSDQGLYANLTAQIVGEIPMDDGNSIYSDAYTLMRMKMGYSKTIKKWTGNIFVGINNLTDEKYASMLLINATAPQGIAPRYYYPGLPRQFYSGVIVSYTF